MLPLLYGLIPRMNENMSKNPYCLFKIVDRLMVKFMKWLFNFTIFCLKIHNTSSSSLSTGRPGSLSALFIVLPWSPTSPCGTRFHLARHHDGDNRAQLLFGSHAGWKSLLDSGVGRSVRFPWPTLQTVPLFEHEP